jgi:hypothetical protein
MNTPIENETNEVAANLIRRHGAGANHIATHRITALEWQRGPGAAQIWRRIRAAIQRVDLI